MNLNDQNNNGEQASGGRPFGGWWIIFAVAALVALLFTDFGKLTGGGAEDVPLSELIEKIENNRVAKLNIEKPSGVITGEYNLAGRDSKKPKTFVSEINIENAREIEALMTKHNVKFTYSRPSAFSQYGPMILIMVVISAAFYFLIMRQMRGPGGNSILSFGKSRASRYTRDKNRKTFDDVAGIDEAREEVREIIEFLRSPEKFQRLGGRLPCGVLLIGSPGTGKTLLAKAIAGEADVPFFSISGSDFVEMFVGVGASRVRDLFEQAKANSPCIIFLDEIDAVGRKRVNDLPGSGVETAQTLNAILVEMDGFTSDDNVIVLAATNRPDVLDPALLRPGRFDRRIYVDLPDIRGREAIVSVHAKKVKMADDVDIKVVARGTPTFSGADLENLVNEAALIAVMRDKDAVDMECFEEARDKVRFGKEKRSRQMDIEDRRATAYHEAGHALLMRFMPHVTPLHKVTIIPRGRALGATMQLPEKDEYNMGKKRILGEVAVRLGGRIAEELFLDDITNGAAQDFEQATHLVRSMVMEWGMSENLGVIAYSDRNMHENAMFETREYSEETAKQIDAEVRRIMDECYKSAKAILSEHRDDVELLVEGLMEFEVLSSEEVDVIMVERGLATIRERRANRKNVYDPSEHDQSEDDSVSLESANDASRKEGMPEDANDESRGGGESS